MDLKKEWKEIKGYEGKYIISNYGEIISLPRYKKNNSKMQYVEPKEILKYPNPTNGYVYVYLCNDGKNRNVRLHRLVAEAFIPNPENKPQVNHKDGDKTNNRIDNLEWCNQSENEKHAWEQGLKIVTKKHSKASKENGEKYRSIQINQYDIQGNYIKTWNSVREIERTLKVHGICQCCKGRCKTIGGYIWKYRSDTNVN